MDVKQKKSPTILFLAIPLAIFAFKKFDFALFRFESAIGWVYLLTSIGGFAMYYWGDKLQKK